MIHPEPKSYLDKVLVIVIALVAAVGAWILASRLSTVVLEGSNPDIYFSSDASRVQANMVTRNSDHWRTGVHPLFSLEMHTAFVAVAAIMHADISNGDSMSPGAIAVSRVMSGIAAGLAAGLFFALLRTMKISRLDAVVFCVLAAFGAFSLFWFSIPETYPWGSVTILVGLLLAAIGSFKAPSIIWYVITSVLTLSVTTTNWMVGILAMWTRFTWRKTIIWTTVALFITVGLSLVQKKIFPSAWLFVRPWTTETRYVMQPQQSGGPVRCVTSFFSHTMIMPEITTTPHIREAGKYVMRTQFSAPASASVMGKVALACWVLLMVSGVYALFTIPDMLPLRITLGLTLLGQLALHSIYGSETFLYAAHYGPLLVAMTALATRTRYRIVVLILAAVMIVGLVFNNFAQLDHAYELIHKFCPN